MRTLSIIAFIIATMAVGARCEAQAVDMGKIALIESSGCKHLVGDNGKALGCYQLHEGVVLDYNRAHKTAYKHKDVMRQDIGLMIGKWYMDAEIPRLLKHYKQKDTLETRITAWNMGVGNVIKGKVAKNYINKYKAIK